MEFPGGNFHRMIPEQGCYDSESWKLSVPPRSNVTRYVPVFPDPATVDGGLRGGDPGVAEGEYRVFVRFQEQVLDRPNFIVSVQSEPVELPDDLSAGTTAFWAFPELELAERDASWDAYNGWVALFKVGCLIVPHCIDPLVLIPELDDPFASMRQAFMTAARADIDIVDTSHNQTRVKTEWINRTVYQEVCAPNNLGRNCPSLPHMIWFDRATARLHVTTSATAEFPTIQDPKPWMSIETYEQDGLKHTLATWRVYGVDKRIRWNHPYEEEIRINHSADIDVLFGVSLEMGPYRGAPYVDPDGGVIDHSAWRSNPADSYWLTISGDTDSLQAEGTGIQGVNASGLVVGECAPKGISVEVQAPSAGTYYLRVFNDNLLPPLDWDWETNRSPARALGAGDETTFYFNVCPDPSDETFEFWLYRQSWVPGVFFVVDKVSQRVAADENIYEDGDAIRLLDGRINGQSLNVDAPTISVTSGEAISGVAIIAVTNAHRSHAVFPVGATPSWGPHESSYWTIDGWAAASATTEYEVPINLTAPMEPGTYAIIFAAAAETSLAHVMSATHWASGSPTWDDGDDIAGWNTLNWDSAIRHGFVIAPHFGKSSERFGAAVIRIEVVADPAVKGMQTRFASVSAGSSHTCGLKRDGAVACWGRDHRGQAKPPAGEFVSVSAGFWHTCGVKRDGSVACWGWDDYGRAAPPAGEFASVSAGAWHTCGVKRDGSVACWGRDDDGQATPPAGEFASVSAGAYHTCGVQRDGSVACWGRDDDGQATPPAGEFASVSAGAYHTCGVQRDGSVACWGSNTDLNGDVVGQATPPAGEFTSVSAGSYYACGVRRDGSVACWGYDRYGEDRAPAGEFASVSTGSYYACGVRRDGSVACWGPDDYGRATPPAGEFTSVSAGVGYTCGVRRDGSVACWGRDDYGRATPPAGEFASVSTGSSYRCGVQRDGSVACWGWEVYGRATPPAGEFASVSAGDSHTCGVRRDGSVACWGRDHSGQATPPAGEFASVSAGDSHTCGVRRDGSVACWGSNTDDDGEEVYGQATPPAGEFASASSGWLHTCGVQRDGTIACWGWDDYGQATPPAGEFASVSAGFRHTCGVRRNGSVACWGTDEFGRATPPAGEFASVSAGGGYTCGVKRDGSVACWGSQARGLTQADFE